jgi:Protein of unknown function (DUF1579)
LDAINCRHTEEAIMSQQDLLTALVGEWGGIYRLWLEPGVLRSESPARATIRPVLDGRYVVHDYGWADQGAPQHGTMLLGSDGDGVWHMAWIDTWHTGRSIMACKGEAGADATMLGSYDGGGQTWGWRTTWAMPDADHLVVMAWNLSPQGQEDKATETVYERRG